MNKLDCIIHEMKDELIASIQENVAIKSVGEGPEEGAPFGKGPRKALDNFMDISKGLGFDTGCFENMVGWAEYGDKDAPMVCILGHMDVVPEGDGWTYPPYGAEIHEGKMYGRGVVDDKGPVICSLYALKAVVKAGIPLKNRVRILVGTNEELGSKAVKKYVEAGQELPVAGFTPDADYPLINGEKGILICRGEAPFTPEGDIQVLSMKGGIADNVVPAHCEAVLKIVPELLEKVCYSINNWEGPERTSASYKENEDGTVTISVEGVSGHGSTPHVGVNSIAWMVKLLLTLGIRGEQGKFLASVNRLIGTEYHGESLGICLYDDVSHYTSLCWGTMDASEGRVSFTINPRYPVTFKEEDVLPVLTSAFEKEGISISATMKDDPLFMSEDSELVQKLMKVYREKTGRDEMPLAIGGGTYAKAMPNILAFGPEMPGKSYNIHEADEGWEIEDMMNTAKIMAAAIIELAQ